MSLHVCCAHIHCTNVTILIILDCVHNLLIKSFKYIHHNPASTSHDLGWSTSLISLSVACNFLYILVPYLSSGLLLPIQNVQWYVDWIAHIKLPYLVLNTVLSASYLYIICVLSDSELTTLHKDFSPVIPLPIHFSFLSQVSLILGGWSLPLGVHSFPLYYKWSQLSQVICITLPLLAIKVLGLSVSCMHCDCGSLYTLPFASPWANI